MNPIIYAFWYPEFRTRLARGWRRRKRMFYCCRENRHIGNKKRQMRRMDHQAAAEQGNLRRKRTLTI